MGGWRKLHNELHNLYSPLHIFRVIKVDKKRDHLENLGLGESVIFEWTLQK